MGSFLWGACVLVAIALLLAARLHFRRHRHADDEQWNSVLEKAPIAIFVQSGGAFVYANAATLSLLGAHDREQLLGQVVADRIHPDSVAAAAACLARLEGLGESGQASEIQLLRLDGMVVTAKILAMPIHWRRDDDLLVFAEDVSDRKAAESKIHFLAYHDRLTSLPNRELFYDRLSQAISRQRRKKGRLALMFLDLDGFKAINDAHGHQGGDTVLKAVADRLTTAVRQMDTIARLGGDEFAVVLSEIDQPSDAANVAEKIIHSLQKPISLNEKLTCTVGVSIGIAIYPEDGTEIDTLLTAADRAMYKSKRAGTNRFSFLEAAEAPGTAPDRQWMVLDKQHLVGISEIDEQHRRMAEILNRINDAVVHNHGDSGVVRQAFDELIATTRMHFADEERLMEQHGYPQAMEHMDEHRGLEKEICYLKGKLANGGELLVLQTLKDWLFHHIQRSDKQLGTYLSQCSNK